MDEVAEGVAGTRLEKAVYGRSRYDESYYDPPAIREFLRSTLYAFTKKDLSWTERRLRVEKAAKLLGIGEDLARTVFDRLSIIEAVKEKAATWDYAWWDASSWSLEGSGGAVEFVTYDLTVEAVEYEQLIDAQGGGLWDHSCWEYCFWTPIEPAYRFDPERLKAVFDIYRDFVVSGFRRRYLATALAVANYQTAEERADWRSGRTETYALPAAQRARIESVAEGVVRTADPGVDAFKLRLYKTAALELYGALYGVHRWGSEMQRALSSEELKSFWIGKWSDDGLDPAVLEKLWEAVKPVVDVLGAARLQARARFIREKLLGKR